jgi:AraC-like DNA-binding protein
VVVELTTRGIAEGERGEFWREALSRSFVPVELVLSGDVGVFGSVRAERVGEVSVADVSSSALEIRRHPRLIGSADDELLHVAVSRRGYGYLSQDGREVCMRPGEPVIYETPRPFHVRFDEPWEATVLTVPRELIALTQAESSRVTARPLPKGSRLNATISRAILDMTGYFDSIPAALAPRLLIDLTDLALALVRDEARRQERVVDLTTSISWAPGPRRLRLLSQIKDDIEQNLTDPALSPSVIAAVNHISIRYLYKLFADESLSVSGYIRQRRLRQCAHNLGDPNLAGIPVAVLARRAGFGDIRGFGRAFKAAYGSTPTEYRTAAMTGQCAQHA